MTYYADLSVHEYDASAPRDPSIRNVGWLARWHRFQHGDVPAELVATLARLCASPVRRMRGFHRCEFCNAPDARGNAEIRVAGKSGIVYAAPTLVLHYVTEHRYLPPREFLEALREA